MTKDKTYREPSNLKRDIEEILEPKCLRSGCEIKHRCNPKTATTQIINLIESVIPEEKEKPGE